MGRGIDPNLDESGGTNALGSESKPWTSAQITTLNSTTVNGTTVNGTTVNGTTGNFTDINVTNVNGRPSLSPTFSDFRGFKSVSTVNTLTINMTADYEPFTGSALDVTIDASTVGANGLDTGTIGSAVWYYTYVIFGTSGIAGLLSASSTAPTLPSGYTEYVRVGSLRSTTGLVFFTFSQVGSSIEFIPDGTLLTTFPVIASGTGSFVQTSTSVNIPPTAAKGEFRVTNNTASTTVGIGVTNAVLYNSVPSGSSSKIGVAMHNAYVYYYSTSSTGALAVIGWEDNL